MRHWYNKSKMTQTGGKVYCVHGLEELILLRWPYYLRQSTDVMYSLHCAVRSHFNHVWLFAHYGLEHTSLFCPWNFLETIHWSGLSCPPPGHLQNPGVEPASLMSLALEGGFITTSATWEAQCHPSVQFSSLSCVWLFATPWTAAHQASLSITNSWSLLKFMSIELVMSSNHLILCHTLLLLPSIFLSIRVFSNESVLCREGNGNPLQYSCLENPMDGRAWWATVHGVLKSRTRLSDFTFIFTFLHWRRKWQLTSVFLPGESQRWRSLVGCCLWGHTELDTTEAT